MQTKTQAIARARIQTIVQTRMQTKMQATTQTRIQTKTQTTAQITDTKKHKKDCTSMHTPHKAVISKY